MKILLKILAPIVILGLAIAGFLFLKSTKPEPKSQEPKPVVPQAEIIRVSPADHSPPVLSFGTVRPLFETSLTPQVSGRITRVAEDFRIGRIVSKGTTLVEIDPTDFNSTVSQLQSNLATAERTFAEEEIRAEQAAADWKASGRSLETASSFVLREPQLAAARSAIDGARAAVEKAEADIGRTKIVAPFDAVVSARSASLGNLASPQTPLGSLVSTEAAELALPLSANEFTRIKLPTMATLSSPTKPGVEWQARIDRLSPTVDRNQTITAIAEVQSPYAAPDKVLAIGTFANASIEAEPITSAYALPETALVNDSFIWVVSNDDELAKVNAERLYSQKGKVFVRLSGTEAEPPLSVVSRPLTNFQPGLKVKPVDAEPPTTAQP